MAREFVAQEVVGQEVVRQEFVAHIQHIELCGGTPLEGIRHSGTIVYS